MQASTPSIAPHTQTSEPPKLQKDLLSNQAADVLREYIAEGRLEPGARLVERQLAEMLGISRAPVRDALMQLEREGLVVSNGGGRRVITLDPRDLFELFMVRLALEKLAVELAMDNTSQNDGTELSARLEDMRRAYAARDIKSFRDSDIALHRTIWTQAGNRRLLMALENLIGPLYLSMFNSRNALRYAWDSIMQEHEDLMRCVQSGDKEAAIESVERHLRGSFDHLTRSFGDFD